jgi:hypothetical protein
MCLRVTGLANGQQTERLRQRRGRLDELSGGPTLLGRQGGAKDL